MLHLDREIKVPGDFHAGLASERPELLRTIDRELTREEGRAVADAMATLLSTLLKTQARLRAAEGRLAAVWEHVMALKEIVHGVERQLGAVRAMTEIATSEDDDEEPETEDLVEAEPRADRPPPRTARG